MVTIAVRNPYYDKEYKVLETMECIEHAVRNIQYGDEPFLKLHDENGALILINPANFASVEVRKAVEE